MNKPVYRHAEPLGEHFKVLATDLMISVQLQPKMVTITCTTDVKIVANAFDEDLTTESTEAEFNQALATAKESIDRTQIAI